MATLDSPLLTRKNIEVLVVVGHSTAITGKKSL
jgi:hypothetical protein